MKSSFYNVYIQIKEGNYVLFNTLNNSLAIIDEKGKNMIDAPDEFMDEELKEFISKGFIITNESDEKDLISVRMNHNKFKNSKAHFMITITFTCNCACKYCFEGKQQHKGVLDEINSNKIRKFITNLLNANNYQEVQIDWFGGEPLLFLKILEREMTVYKKLFEDRHLPYKFRIYTNGTIWNKKIDDFLSSFNIKDLQITFDGAKEEHDQRRVLKKKAEGTYDLIKKNLVQIVKRFPVILRINIDKVNYRNFGILLNDLKVSEFLDVPLDILAIQSMTSACGNYGNAISDEEIVKLLPSLWFDAIKKGFRIYVRPQTSYIYCSTFCDSTFIFDFNANIFKCAVLQYDETHKIGTLNTEGEIKNLRNEYYQWMSRNPLEFDKCRICKLLPVCGGGCGGAAKYKYGTFKINNCFDNNIDLLKIRLLIHMYYKYPELVSLEFLENYINESCHL